MAPTTKVLQQFEKEFSGPAWCHECSCGSCGGNGSDKDVLWSVSPRKKGVVRCPSGHSIPCASPCMDADCARARMLLASDPGWDGPLELLDGVWVPWVPPARPTGDRVLTLPQRVPRSSRPRRRKTSSDATVQLLKTQAALPKEGSVPYRVLGLVRDGITVGEVQAALQSNGIPGSASSELRYLVKRGFVELQEQDSEE